MSSLTPDELAREFDGCMTRGGLTIPPGRRAAVLASYADFRAQIDLLHGRQDHTGEPAHTFATSRDGDA
jgi:hypothetical protein